MSSRSFWHDPGTGPGPIEPASQGLRGRQGGRGLPRSDARAALHLVPDERVQAVHGRLEEERVNEPQSHRGHRAKKKQRGSFGKTGIQLSSYKTILSVFSSLCVLCDSVVRYSYRAISTARVSRTTVTLISPGKSIFSSIARAM